MTGAVQEVRPSPQAVEDAPVRRALFGSTSDMKADYFREIAKDRRARQEDSHEVARCEQ